MIDSDSKAFVVLCIVYFFICDKISSLTVVEQKNGYTP